ncbi:MAG: site-specific integrase, partial [Clostridia bacterium]|nr:site-specific integrase [Clostridia bacterium]
MNYLSNFINYLKATKNLSSKTLLAYSSDLKQFFEYEKNVLQPDICAYISYINTKLKDASIRRKIITLKNFYDYLLNNEIINCSPFRKLKFKFKQEQ